MGEAFAESGPALQAVRAGIVADAPARTCNFRWLQSAIEKWHRVREPTGKVRMTCGTGAAALLAAPWGWAAVAALLACGCTLVASIARPALRRLRALRRARRQDANARALLQVAEALQAHALSLERCGLGPESRRWANLCRRAAHDHLAVVNELILLSMPGTEPRD